jgi:peroxiredoxin
LLQFWSAWSLPSLASLARVQRLHVRYHDEGLHVVAVSLDAPQDATATRNLVRELRLTFPVALDHTGVAVHAYHVRVLPSWFLIGSDGRLVASGTNDVLADEDVRAALAS